jgi:ribosomal protein S18 acetylase RimI-like enzyme
LIGPRLHAQVRAIASRDRELIRVGPFDAFVDPLRTLKHVSFAVPDDQLDAGHAAAALGELRAVYAQRGRNARVEFVEECAPGLAAVLETGGFLLDHRLPLLVCEPADLAVPPAPQGLRIERLRPDSEDADVRAFLTVQRDGFEDDEAITDAQVERTRARADDAVFLLGLVEGVPAGTAQATPEAVGVSEIVGVATLPPFRRRGIAGVLTAAATAAAFEQGAELAFLTAADEGAARIYRRAGYELRGTQLAYDAG